LSGKTLKKSLKRLALKLSLLAGLAGTALSALPQQETAIVNHIVVDGSINPAVDDFIRENISRAKASGARALLIQLDTPGGLLESTRTIVKEMLGAQVPIMVYVAPSGAGAGSAGVFITMAAHVAAMAPGTNIGAAHPVAGGGQEVKGVMGEKIENFTASFGETIAQRRGRNAEWAIQAVRKSVAITEKEALTKNVIDVVARDIADLLRQAHGRKVDLDGREIVLDVANAQVVRLEMNLKQRVLNAIANPNIAYLLMMAGILGLYMEFSNPGVIFPGVAGAICLLLAFASLQVLPFNYVGLILIALGLGLLAAEAFMPSFGVLGIGGIVALTFGSLLIFDPESTGLALDRSIIFTAVATLSSFVFIISYLVFRSQRSKPTLGFEGLLGEIGEVRSILAPRGKVFVHGEYWNAEAEGEIAPGERVEVVGVNGMTLKVRRARSDAARS
jgi:membrane-bound serine protease (ClpP class)